MSSTSAGWPSSSSVEGRSVDGAHVNHGELLGHAHLLRGEADAVVFLHRLEHVGDELFDFRRDAFNPRAFFAQHRMAVFDNF